MKKTQIKNKLRSRNRKINNHKKKISRKKKTKQYGGYNSRTYEIKNEGNIISILNIYNTKVNNENIEVLLIKLKIGSKELYKLSVVTFNVGEIIGDILRVFNDNYHLNSSITLQIDWRNNNDKKKLISRGKKNVSNGNISSGITSNNENQNQNGYMTVEG